MPTYKTAGIVIRRFNFGEADRIITFITPDRGRIKAVARGVRRIKSRMAGHLELFSHVGLMLANGRNLDVITSAQLVRFHQGVSGDYDRLSQAYLFAEMLDKLTAEAEPHPGIFDILQQSLAQLELTGSSALTQLYFRLRLAAALGYSPQLAVCTNCGATSPESSYFFSPDRGGIVCSSCRSADSLPISLNQIKLWRLILSKPLLQIMAVADAEQLAASSSVICDSFYDQVFGQRFKSSQVLTSNYEPR